MPDGQDAKAIRQDQPVVVMGGGGHARILISLLSLQHRQVRAVLDDDTSLHHTQLDAAGVSIAGGLDTIAQHAPDSVELVNAIGSVHRPTARQAIYEKFSAMGYRFATLIHPAATIAPKPISSSALRSWPGRSSKPTPPSSATA